ncbi:DUF4184 family protein [Myceligenerans pegani]|uniref:DUF4184 family protein n=1 Tax=Myceligenerans pegani TaxID=2776917 RepID=A0ABR9MX86_9MICO|nr:DUF4184 family protein [Myceligenerans sp. TRM 65318]MBE1875740.1 DUF4184 family protein [Myceligenerans sp. TRM 65318]MBE3018011.1 DUF4184 family protein [Myceligenerans sp. TRM 65318]
MPFTLSHPAAVLPFVRRPLSAAGLVAGAIAPDLPYFARALPVPVTAQSWYEPYLNATTSHGLTGSLTVGLPYAILLAAAWWAARRPAAALLVAGPTADGAAPRDDAGGGGGLRPVAVRGGWILLSLLIGIATHLLWDSFTHGDGYVVTHVAALSDPAIGGLTWARLLQHVSTVAGLVVLAWYLWRRRSGLRVRAGAAVTVLAVAAAGAVAGALLQWRSAAGDPAGVSVEVLLRAAAETAGVTLFGAAAVYVAAWWLVHANRHQRRNSLRRPASTA